jgi:CRISPR/Cas system-associated exonuclease Cas4 (RecB family)
MAELPPVQSQTVAAIYAAREAENKHWDSIGLPIGELGSDCDAALWFTFRLASEPETLTGQKLRLFETGHIEEARLIADLRRINERSPTDIERLGDAARDVVDVMDIDPETGRQFKVYLIGGHVRGKLDGMATGIPEAPKKRHVIECKSHNDKSFKLLVKSGVKLSKPGHYRQCLIYMHRTGIDRCLYLAVNKNTDEVYSERLRYDPVEALTLISRLERVIRSNRLPPKISEDQTKWPCTLCKHNEVCSGQVFGRNHCRTCLHSSPCIDEGSDDARWHCSRFGKDLSVEEQRSGCPAHLYLPDVVPGEQTDAGDDWVSYVLRDGQVWRDGVPAGTRFWWKPETQELWSTEFASHDSGVSLGDIEELDAFEYAAAARWLAEQKGEAK